MAFGDTKESPDEICGDQANPGTWPYITKCVAPPNHTDAHLDRKGRAWYRNRGNELTLEQPSRVSIARLRAIGYNEWADQATKALAQTEKVRAAAQLPVREQRPE